jgi:hypothetical protein
MHFNKPNPSVCKNIKIRICKTVVLLVILHGCKTWSLTLRGEYTLKVFENRELRRIFGPKRNEVAVGWRKLHNGEFLTCTLHKV